MDFAANLELQKIEAPPIRQYDDMISYDPGISKLIEIFRSKPQGGQAQTRTRFPEANRQRKNYSVFTSRSVESMLRRLVREL